MSSAEDLAQETFLRAFKGLNSLQDPRAFGSWLLTIADYVCREWIRRKRTNEKYRDFIAEAARANVPPPEPPDHGVAEAIAALPTEVQQILALRHGGGLSCKEIAAQLGRPLGTITKTLSRAYETLREKLIPS
jgi:RNA polymerase sigma-70 factor (ECF subfamily)